MTGKAGSISLARLATSQPSILSRPRLMSVTSARYFPSDASSNSTEAMPCGSGGDGVAMHPSEDFGQNQHPAALVALEPCHHRLDLGIVLNGRGPNLHREGWVCPRWRAASDRLAERSRDQRGPPDARPAA